MPAIVPVTIAIICTAILTMCVAQFRTDQAQRRKSEEARLRTQRRQPRKPADAPDARMLNSNHYWDGLAAGARFLGTYRSPTEINTCWDGMIADQMHGSQAEQDFATGWMRSVRHMMQHLPA